MERFDAEVLAYCQMGNHHHLVVHTCQANLSRLMRHLNGMYTQGRRRRRLGSIAMDCTAIGWGARLQALQAHPAEYIDRSEAPSTAFFEDSGIAMSAMAREPDLSALRGRRLIERAERIRQAEAKDRT